MQCNRMHHTTSSSDGSRGSWKIGDSCWGDFAASTTRTVPINTNANTALVVPSNNGGTATPSSPILPAAIVSPSTSLSLLPSRVARSSTSTSTSDTTLSNENNNAAVAIAPPDSVVSSSSPPFPDFAGSAAISPSFLPTSSTTTTIATEANRKCNGDSDSGDDKRSSVCRREWKTGDWCWLKEEREQVVNEEQEESAVEHVNANSKEEQEVVVSSCPTEMVIPSPKPVPIHGTRTKRNCRTPRIGGRRVKRKAAATISGSTGTNDDTSDKDCYNQNITEGCEEDHALVGNANDFSDSETKQGPKTKKTKKKPCQVINDKRWEEMYLITPTREEMTAVFLMCRGNQWNSVLNSIRSNRLIQTTNITTDNNFPTTVIHQAIRSKGDINKRAIVIKEILQVTPHAAYMKNGLGSLPLHVICQRNVKMNSATKETLIRDLINAYSESLTVRGGVAKRTPLHIIFTDYVSAAVPELMIHYGREACFMRDKNGFLPAHVACSRHCSLEKLKMLLDVNPGALFEKTNDGKTPLDLAKLKATKSHPNVALITDIERRVKTASLRVSASVAMGHFDAGFDLNPDLDIFNQSSVSFDSITESATGNGSPLSQENKPKRKIKQEDTSSNEVSRKKIEQNASRDEVSQKKIQREDSDPANLLLHSSHHTDYIVQV
mmetsp:Transcript_13925/g.29319  ORF Transcript_13925/g.29319 Transcript_13925/m.29319 type:complete len:663 (-) Transcript_13925:431-2419(-)